MVTHCRRRDIQFTVHLLKVFQGAVVGCGSRGDFQDRLVDLENLLGAGPLELLEGAWHTDVGQTHDHGFVLDEWDSELTIVVAIVIDAIAAVIVVVG